MGSAIFSRGLNITAASEQVPRLMVVSAFAFCILALKAVASAGAERLTPVTVGFRSPACLVRGASNSIAYTTSQTFACPSVGM